MGTGTSIGRVRGLGAAREGTHHWWHQRLTAGGNLLLVVWFLASVARLPAYDAATVQIWLSSPWAAIPMALLVLNLFYHARLGLQIAIEDYAHREGGTVLLVLLNLVTVVGAAIGVFSILKIAFTGASA
ncbi:succinate dehydrogenase, hydrophobic membrane anchor protein [Stakelama saccharophila]|uniref:Succinate dehydrogenase hydrophobic membrane anchor subunit n=1 Tax=Stakelama saccharophila TaxID=3075605 RepID=A0ABZ0BCM6_9SPHN|nr:succinate dehydrogenase, hydrophobic membrane anchor protein [Stakelama sp. W311]WNO54431.1 succinate dehydrogenase, hydrophobic membrane anchor protein [Stakelama sp. W311]